METRMLFFLINLPISPNCRENPERQGDTHIGCEAKGTISELILKKRIPLSRLNFSILLRHSRFSATVRSKRSLEYDPKRKVWFGEHPTERFMQGYPTRILPPATPTALTRLVVFPQLIQHRIAHHGTNSSTC
jgi:hypothetical protein